MPDTFFDAVQRLKAHLAPIVDLRHAAAVLGWDQQTHMPPGGGQARAEQLATLSRIIHEMFTAPRTRELLEAAPAPPAGGGGCGGGPARPPCSGAPPRPGGGWCIAPAAPPIIWATRIIPTT